jgi:predicted CoA-binding protein
MSAEKILVIGASEKTERYSNKAIRMLRKYHYEVVAIGNKAGKIEDVSFGIEKIAFYNIDTVTLYIGEKHQAAYYDYVLSLNPKRIIFNPGTENDAFEKMAKANNIQCLEACTLVMLSTGQF